MKLADKKREYEERMGPIREAMEERKRQYQESLIPIRAQVEARKQKASNAKAAHQAYHQSRLNRNPYLQAIHNQLASQEEQSGIHGTSLNGPYRGQSVNRALQNTVRKSFKERMRRGKEKNAIARGENLYPVPVNRLGTSLNATQQHHRRFQQNSMSLNNVVQRTQKQSKRERRKASQKNAQKNAQKNVQKNAQSNKPKNK
jgi:hypothetical protein